MVNQETEGVGEMAFEIRWLGTACFEIRLENQKTIVIDPYLDDSVSAPITSDKIEGCDYIFITHGHYDHVLDVGKLVSRFGSEIFCTQEVAGALAEHQAIDPGRFLAVAAGDVVERDGVRAEVVRGVHVDFFAEYARITGGDLMGDSGGDLEKMMRMGLETLMGPEARPPEQAEEWMTKYPQGDHLNFVFDIGGGKRIYMAGSYPDSSLLDVARESDAYMMLLQVLPGKTGQGLEEQVLEFALASGAEIVVPQHHDPLMEGAHQADLSQFKQLFEKHDVQFIEFNPGKWYEFG
jgi:L-ascorbate metabolism protein UlaG (beta-lactamase superfamily)